MPLALLVEKVTHSHQSPTHIHTWNQQDSHWQLSAMLVDWF